MTGTKPNSIRPRKRCRDRGAARLRFWLAALGGLGLGLAPLAPLRGAEPVDYQRDVAPLLARHCVACHGPDQQESSLRLDTPAGLNRGGVRGPLWIAGQSQQSLLMEALRGSDNLERMPAGDDPLSEAEIALFGAWIDAGAVLPAEVDAQSASEPADLPWSYRPLVAVAPPAAGDSQWPRNAIDHFIEARLREAGLAPSPEADRPTLIRRLSLDLIGLPPSPAEVEAFLLDHRPDAYERLVEALLASPHYGERWGRHWLDLARYADSNGYTIDGPRSIWKYRDWVIEALNRDLAFDQFTIEQLAGDLLPGATLDQQVATGFHRNTLKNEEGGTDPEQFRVEAVADRVNTTGQVWLGLTVGCARCHDHKYDPLTQREYYELFAFFNQCDEPTLPVPSPDEAAQLAAIDQELEALRGQLAEVDAELPARQQAWEAELSPLAQVAWHVLVPDRWHAEHGTTLTLLDDHSLLAQGPTPEHDDYQVFVPYAGRVSALRLEVLADDRLPQRGPGRASNGNFVLSELTLAVGSGSPPAQAAANTAGAAATTAAASAAVAASAGAAGPIAAAPLPAPQSVSFSQATADHSQVNYAIASAIDGDLETGWAINTEMPSQEANLDRTAVLRLAEPLELSGGQQIVVTLRHQTKKNPRYQIGRFRLSVSGSEPRVLQLSEEVRAVLVKPASERTADEQKLLRAAYQAVDPPRQPLAAAVAKIERRKDKLLEKIPSTLALVERAERRPTAVHLRGDFLRAGAAVEPATPQGLPPLAIAGSGPATRLDLARWLVDPRNPLTPRVTVNRVWQQYFGRGLVETENDFGTQGSLPTHPELLDWLATDFVQGGWSLKHLHRRIVSSAAYRQASQFREDLEAVDPRNLWLGRQNRLRLEAEIVRDEALAASGLLNPAIGGPGVYPPQPEGIYRFTQQNKSWPESRGPDRYRRTLYTFFWRSSPFPLLSTFDAPDANVACTRRTRSNTPLQSLTLANDRGFVELAQGLALRSLREAPGGGAQTIDRLFRLALVRGPLPAETQRLAELYRQELARLEGDSDGAAKLAPADRPPALSAAEAGAWTMVARTVLNLDEFVTRP